MASYPKGIYKPNPNPVDPANPHDQYIAKTVYSADEERALGAGWYSSPAEFGVETAPGKRPDPAIAAKRAEFEAKKKQGK